MPEWRNVCRGLVGGYAFFWAADTHRELHMRRRYVRLGVKTPQVTLSSSYNLLFIDWQGVDTRAAIELEMLWELGTGKSQAAPKWH